MPEHLLSSLLTDLPVDILSDFIDTQITGLVSDSRQVKPGYLFVAVPGSNVDGHRYIAETLEKGAAAVVGMEPGIKLAVPYIQVSDTRRALPHLASAFYAYPGQKLCVIGVTGTDGKTTTTNLIYQILIAAGLKTGMISTVNAVIGDKRFDTGFHVTTPEAVDVQRYLAMMVEAGLTHAVLETTSHGWSQHRTDGCEFDVAVITNITHEHLDEHGNMDNYRQAKARLFQSLVETKVKPGGNPRTAILNRDDGSYPFISEICNGLPGVTNLAYGFARDAQVQAEKIVYGRNGVVFNISLAGDQKRLTSKLVGAYNVSNIMAAYAATVGALGISPDAAQKGIASLEGIPGRMEAIDLGQDFMAYVDFAHTPNALRRTLETAREMTTGKVIVTFGAAGLRDRQKRRMMAEFAIALADKAVFTAEDPRSEALEDILLEMAKGAEAASGREGETFWRVPDRGDALRKAVALAQPGDIVLACGKGHEQSMCFGTVEYAWDDRVAMWAALAEYLGIQGKVMPNLPTSG